MNAVIRSETEARECLEMWQPLKVRGRDTLRLVELLDQHGNWVYVLRMCLKLALCWNDIAG